MQLQLIVPSRGARPRERVCSYRRRFGFAKGRLLRERVMLLTRISELMMQGPKLNPASLDLRPLYYFVQVAELGSFSRAAAALSMGQPIVSRFIRRLEDELQVQLFHRHGRGVQLTEAGDRLLEHGKAIL